MRTNLEIYGTDDVPKIPEAVCNQRIKLLKDRLDMLLAPHFMEQDSDLINTVIKARDFWLTMRNGEEL